MPDGLLAPRLYRAAFLPALLALIVVAFSLQEPTGPISPELSPPGFSAARAQQVAAQAVEHYGARQSGSVGDAQFAELVEARLKDVGFGTSTKAFTATTLNGRRTLTNVVGVRPGPTDRRLLVIASRDGSPGKLKRAGALETGVLLELARVLQGRTFEHTLVLASVSGGVDGGLGAARLLRELHGPLDAVVVVRNVTAQLVDAPVLTAGDSRLVPDGGFVGTVRRIAGVEFGRAGEDRRRSLPAQLVRLGFPVALGEQAGMAAAGINGLSISPAGEPLVASDADATELAGSSGRTVLRTLTTLDGDSRATPPGAAPLRIGGMQIPQWAIVLLIGTLFFPLVIAAVDAWARSHRRRRSGQRGMLAPAIALVWLLALGLLLRAAGLSGILDAPGLPPDPGAVSGAGASVLGVLALVLAVAGVLVAAGSARQASPKGGEAAFALWIVFAGLAIFAVNPLAAGFVLVLSHLLLLMLLTSAAPRRRQVALLTLIGIAPLLLAATYYPVVFAIAPGGVLRYGVLLLSGGFVSLPALVAGCAFVAAAGTALIQLWWSAPRPSEQGTRRRVTQSF